MAAKYDNYFLSGPIPGREAAKLIADLNGDLIKGSNRYLVNWVFPSPDELFGVSSWDQISHGPHIHKSAEILMHIGTDPENPYDLGAEVELCLGPEMEKHIITKSTVTYIPPDFIHGPWTVKRVARPFIMIQVNQEPTHTEKSLKNLVPEKERDRMMFIDEGYEGKEAVWQFPKASRMRR
jgi:hypothetical protein